MIVREIEKRYPVEFQFNYEQNTYPVSLTFADSIPAEEQNALIEELEDCFLTIASPEQYRAIRLRVERTPEFPAILCLPEGGKCYFPEGNTNRALFWAIYAWASGAAWKDKLSGREITSKLYSASQQYAALSVLRRVVRQLDSHYPEEKMNRVFAELDEIPKDHLAQAPRLWDQPIPEGNYSRFRQTGIFKAAPKWDGGKTGQFMTGLFGRIDYREQAEAYAKLCLSGTAYAESLSEARHFLLNALYHVPCNSVINALNYLRDKATEKYRSSAEIEEEIRAAFNRPLPSFELQPAAIKSALQNAQSVYEQYICQRIGRRFFGDLLSETLENELAASRKQACDELKRANRELLPFCRINDSSAPEAAEESDWSDMASVIELGRIRNTGWEARGTQALLQNQADLYNLWLMPAQIFNQMDGQAGSFEIFSVPVTERGYIWQLRAMPMKEESAL